MVLDPAPTVTQSTLRAAKVGDITKVLRIETDPRDAALLRAMGLRPGCTLRVCRAGEPTIVEIECPCGGACRIGIARHVATKVIVEKARA